MHLSALHSLQVGKRDKTLFLVGKEFLGQKMPSPELCNLLDHRQQTLLPSLQRCNLLDHWQENSRSWHGVLDRTTCCPAPSAAICWPIAKKIHVAPQKQFNTTKRAQPPALQFVGPSTTKICCPACSPAICCLAGKIQALGMDFDTKQLLAQPQALRSAGSENEGNSCCGRTTSAFFAEFLLNHPCPSIPRRLLRQVLRLDALKLYNLIPGDSFLHLLGNENALFCAPRPPRDMQEGK